MNNPVKEWPPADLESVPTCPICGHAERTIAHRRLVDWVFDASGEWDLWRCVSCGSGYLDPRPTQESLHRAYATYYTHGGEPAIEARKSILVRLKFALGNDYSNHRFGSADRPAFPGGRWIGRFFPAIAQSRDIKMRHLPKPSPGRNRLLDVGSGDGSFLKRAAAAGWDVSGIEPDPSARAASVGLNVRATMSDWAGGAGFDAVTVNHAIEHMYDPVKALREIADLMKEGAFLFLDTPNVDAAGHDLFGRHWRGLEPPRHLVLFSLRSLAKALDLAGFAETRMIERPSVFAELTALSRKIAIRAGEIGGESVLDPTRTQFAAASATERRCPSKREFLTFVAIRGSK